MGLLQSFVLFYEPKYFCLTLQLTSTSVRPQGAFAMSFSRAGILQQMHWLHLLHAISFLPCPVTYWQLPITPSRFSAFSFLGYWLSMGEREGSRWGQRVFHSLWIAQKLTSASPLHVHHLLLTLSARASYFLVLSLPPCCTHGLFLILHQSKTSWGKAQWIPQQNKHRSPCGLLGCKQNHCHYRPLVLGDLCLCPSKHRSKCWLRCLLSDRT